MRSLHAATGAAAAADDACASAATFIEPNSLASQGLSDQWKASKGF